ncbi:MAG: HD domain-containing protein [Kiritimatiellales bacterium]|nr:HD domain-containing protein [Kiritimatiellales bacterium]
MAFERGKEAHNGQKRKSGEPYFIHCIAVAHLLADMKADADTIIAALLHDAIEDTALTLEMVEKEFDHSAASLIDGVTKLDESELKENPTLEQETETIRKIFTYMQKDVRIMIIKLADRMHNMQTIEFLQPKRQQSLAEETLTVYVKIADRLSMRDFRDELEALCLDILDPDQFEQLSILRKKNEKVSENNIKNILACLNDAYPSISNNFTIKQEPKSWGRLRTQLNAEGATVTGISALTAVFICKNIESCYKVFGALHQCYQRETLSFEDFINAPQINGYQGLHTTIIMGDGTRVRCKLRTQEMDEYAHNGITTKCFDSEPIGLLDYLPWTERIATLSADTSDRSEQFFASLQSDILGESIVIHGPNDKTIILPKGSTALDGAIYLFEGQALTVTSIKVNGKEVPFSTPLEHAASIDLTLSDTPVVKREWLEWIQTGLATATIRTALAQQSDRRKINIGQGLLRKTLEAHKIGYIEEFNQKSVEDGLRALGYSSLRKAYIAIADGHLEPEEIYISIVEPKNTKSSQRKIMCVIRYSVPVNNPEIHSKLAEIHHEFGISSKQVRYKQDHKNPIAFTTVRAHLEIEQQRIYISKLKAAGATQIKIEHTAPIIKLFFGIGSIILLWGLDPVLARFLILYDHLTPVDFTLLRIWSLTLILILLTSFGHRRKILEPLRVWNPLIWSSAILLALVSLTTYAALEEGTATHYEIIMTASVLLGAIAFRSLSWKKGLPTWILFGLSMILLLQSPAWNMRSGIFMLISLICFTAFLIVSNVYLRQEFIARRRLEYYTAMLTICSICTIPLLAFVSPVIKDPMTILHVFIFSTVFIGLPYYLYYEWSPKQKANSMIPFASVMLTVTFVGEFVMTRQFDIFTLLAFIAMVSTAYLLERQQED